MKRLLAALALTVAVAGCGGSSGNQQLGSTTASSAGRSADASPQVQGPVAGAGGGCVSAAPTQGAAQGTSDLTKKPQITVPAGPPPCNLVIGDIVVGTGPAAKPGDHLTMKYVGVTYATGKQFDASWDRGQDFPFQLGAGMVIAGWDQGLVGMKVGGRRQLVIPPAMGYGDQAQAGIPANSTLIFVVDLVKIG